MDLRDVWQAPPSRPVALPSQQSPGVRSSNPYRRYPPVNTQRYACIYCRQSHMACDLERPCTRCIKRNIGHLCHDEPLDDDSKKSKTVHATQTAQTDSSSLLDSNLRSCHYTISRDHTEGVEDQKCKVLADFGRKHIRTWTNVSLANINSRTDDRDTSAESRESVNGPEPDAGQDGLPNLIDTYQLSHTDADHYYSLIDTYQLRRVARSFNSQREVSKINFDGFATG